MLEIYNRIDGNERKLTKADRKHLKPLAYKHGTYYHITRPEGIGEAIKKGEEEERMILNINSQRKAAELITYIADGWSGKTKDWRRHVSSAKFLAMSPVGRNAKPDLKYDKVVIYYNKVHQTKIQAGVEARLPENDRNENISAFYVKLGKGMGIGEEKVDKLGDSFTTRRANTLFNWIMKEKGWDEVKSMSEASFVEEAEDVVHAKMSFSDNLRGTMKPLPESEPDDSMFNTVLTELQAKTNGNIDASLADLQSETNDNIASDILADLKRVQQNL